MLYLIIFTLIVFLAFLYNAYDYHKTSHEFLKGVTKAKDKDISDLEHRIEELKKMDELNEERVQESYGELNCEYRRNTNLNRYIRHFKHLKVITEETINGKKYIIHTKDRYYDHELEITVEKFNQEGYVNYETCSFDGFLDKLRESKKPDYELRIKDKNYRGMDYIEIFLNGEMFYYEPYCYGALLNSFNDVKNLYSDWKSGV